MTHSDFDTESVTVLKQDRRGRVLTTPSQRLALLQQFEKCGLSGPQFAGVAGINYQTFVSWRQQQKRQTHSGGAWITAGTRQLC
jgi:DNA-binding transcriptional regulator YiaG